MKFTTALAVFAASAAAWKQTTPGPGVNPELDKVLEGMPDFLVNLLSLVPQDYMNALIGGQAWLPLEPSEFLENAPGIPSSDLSEFTVEYEKFIAKVSSLLPSSEGGKATGNNDENEAAGSPTASEEGDLPSDASDDASAKPSGSAHESGDASDEPSDEDSENDDDSTSGAAQFARPAAAAALVAAAAAFF
ncbi:hypothetical protein IWW51_000364 [Coemansia sp. RSA 2702]|nr:hypothetical protein IWW52_006156 [Coemansia sp. RSA 2704]KAJ2329808.1 hypothetical protein IWW51_000364 [Coemansia sp. RSA 2702]